MLRFGILSNRKKVDPFDFLVMGLLACLLESKLVVSCRLFSLQGMAKNNPPRLKINCFSFCDLASYVQCSMYAR